MSVTIPSIGPYPTHEKISAPQMDYEVLENGEWVSVDPGKASECNGGYLRYIKDGFAKTAATGHWRGVMTNQYVSQLSAYNTQQFEEAKKVVGKRVYVGALLFFVAVAIAILSAISIAGN